MKIFNKFIWSKKEPSNKNDIWFDGSTWRMYTEEAWQSFTLPVDAADTVAKMLENASEVYQEKLNAGYGIVIEGNTISLDVSSIDVDTTHNIGSIELFDQLIKDKSRYDLHEDDIKAIQEGKLITTTQFGTKIPVLSVNHMMQSSTSIAGYILTFYVDAVLYNISIYDFEIVGGLSWKTHLDSLAPDSNFISNSYNAIQNAVVTKKFEETDTQITELSAETKEHFSSQIFEPGNVGASGESANTVVSRTNYIPCKKGDVISGYVYFVKLYDKDFKWLGEEQPNNNNGFSNASHTITNEACAYVRITARNSELNKGAFAINDVSFEYLINKGTYINLETTNVNAQNALSASENNAALLQSFFFIADSNGVTSTSYYIPVAKGDVVSAQMYRLKRYNENRELLGEDLSNIGFIEYVNYEVTDANCKFVKITTRIGYEGEILLNGKNVIPSSVENITRPSTLSKDIYPYKSFDTKDINAINLQIPQFRNNLDGAILGVWVKNPKEGAIYHLSGFRYRQVSADWKNTEYSNITIAIVAETTQYAKILDDFTSESINDGVQVFDTEDYTIIVDWTKAVRVQVEYLCQMTIP